MAPMIERRSLMLAGLLAFLAAACGSSMSAPSGATAQTACQVSNGKVQVVIVYTRDRTKVPSSPLLTLAPLLVLVDFGDRTSSPNSNSPQLTKIDDYTWTTTTFVTPNADPMSHGASVVDIASIDVSSGILVTSGATGVTVNGVQVRKVIVQSTELGYFGVDACGKIFV